MHSARHPLLSGPYSTYSLANIALKYPSERKDALHYLDEVIDTTVNVPWRDFLLPYGSERPFRRQPASSVMVDGEVSLMIGLRRLIEDEDGYPHRDLHKKLITRMKQLLTGRLLCFSFGRENGPAVSKESGTLTLASHHSAWAKGLVYLFLLAALPFAIADLSRCRAGVLRHNPTVRLKS